MVRINHKNKSILVNVTEVFNHYDLIYNNYYIEKESTFFIEYDSVNSYIDTSKYGLHSLFINNHPSMSVHREHRELKYHMFLLNKSYLAIFPKSSGSDNIINLTYLQYYDINGKISKIFDDVQNLLNDEYKFKYKRILNFKLSDLFRAYFEEMGHKYFGGYSLEQLLYIYIENRIKKIKYIYLNDIRYKIKICY